MKGLSIAALALLAFLLGHKVLGIALTLSSIGDVLLDLDPERLFVDNLRRNSLLDVRLASGRE